MRIIFFCADFSTFFYLKLASGSIGGVHKQYGLKRERGRLFYSMYLMTWFIVDWECLVSDVNVMSLRAY